MPARSKDDIGDMARPRAVDGVHEVAPQPRRVPDGETLLIGTGGGAPARSPGDTRGAVPLRGGARRRYRGLAVGMAAVDALCIVDALLLSYLIRWGLQGMPGDYLAIIAAAPLVWIGVFHAFSLYSIRHLSAWEEFRRTISAVSVAMVVLILVSFWSKSSYSRMWVGLTWAFAMMFELLTRRVWRAHVHRLRVSGHLALRTLVVGTQEEAARLSDRLAREGSGFAPVGHVSLESSSAAPGVGPVVSDVEGLADAIESRSIDCLMVAATEASEADMLALVQAARQQDAEVWVSANLPEVLGSRLRVQPIEDVLTLSIKPVSLTGPQVVLKRTFDVVTSISLLVLGAPVMGAIALAIKLTSSGPVLFRQDRVTKGGAVFSMYKFRTMRHDADALLEEADIDPSAPFFKLGESDPRLTRVGRFLRKLSLDELPQLINVVRGEMSLVGPRPLPVDQVAAHLELLGPRHEVRAGMTGWWQVQGRSDLDPHESVRLDMFYIENWSLSLDVFILLKTFGAVMVKKGAY
ncbi:MAG TPA: sugar transferase [Actinomycetota bacterium]|nr:sugar transferase [Actinomycetota bacterium]